MPDTNNLLLFVGAGLLLNITPGPDVLYIVGRSLSQGRLAGVVSALGIAAGCLFHLAAAAFGLSALMLALPLAYATSRRILPTTVVGSLAFDRS
jgi:threonine/homoserine/homoserine lactone efflux protein